jgi:hypothetical protein
MSHATCLFIGRTGNQLWQLAATVNYALKHGMSVGFPERSVNEKEWPLMFKNLPRSRGGYKQWSQPDDGGFYEIPYYQKGIQLKGFFQSYKYIDHPETIAKVKKLIGYQDEAPRNGIAVHVRRGDYLIHKDGFPPLPIDYFKATEMEISRAGFSGIGFHVFSDNIPFCREFLKGRGIIEFHETSSNPVLDLFEMSRYQHSIIANSSYSYWAAMLNPNPDKIVFCPHHQQYYGPANKHLDTTTLYPPNWHQIKF